MTSKSTCRTIKITAGILLLAVIVLVSGCSKASPSLLFADDKNDKILKEIPVSDGDEFSLTFVHSVNKSPVTDVYIIRNGDIYLDRTIYYDFGAGVPTEAYGDQKFTLGDNGEMIMSGYDMLIPHLTYTLSTLNTHTFALNGTDLFVMQDEFGVNRHVHIYCKNFK